METEGVPQLAFKLNESSLKLYKKNVDPATLQNLSSYEYDQVSEWVSAWELLTCWLTLMMKENVLIK